MLGFWRGSVCLSNRAKRLPTGEDGEPMPDATGTVSSEPKVDDTAPNAPSSGPPSLSGEIQEYFNPGFDPDEVTGLWSLKQRLPLLHAFTTLFRGEPTGIVVRVHVLAEMCLRPADTPFWQVHALRQHFAYLTETAFTTVITRLREGDLIGYAREENAYSVTPLGLQVNSAIRYFLNNYEDEGLGLLTGVLFAGEAMGTLSSDDLAHLKSRLGQLEHELLAAIDSASEPAILKARNRFEAIWKRIEQGTAAIRAIAKNPDMDRETHRVGQRVAEAQSRLARITVLFQRAMNDIDRQRMHLGRSGVSTSDLNAYLMARTPDELRDLLDGALGRSVQPLVLLTDLLADVAEYELVERQREEQEGWTMPAAVYSPKELPVEADALPWLDQLVADVAALDAEPTPLASIVPKEGFEISSYRFAMLALSDTGESETDGSLAPLTRLSVAVRLDHGTESVERDGVAAISKGAVWRETS